MTGVLIKGGNLDPKASILGERDVNVQAEMK